MQVSEQIEKPTELMAAARKTDSPTEGENPYTIMATNINKVVEHGFSILNTGEELLDAFREGENIDDVEQAFQQFRYARLEQEKAWYRTIVAQDAITNLDDENIDQQHIEFLGKTIESYGHMQSIFQKNYDVIDCIENSVHGQEVQERYEQYLRDNDELSELRRKLPQDYDLDTTMKEMMESVAEESDDLLI